MIKNVVEHIGGVGIFGVISICLFFTFFVGMLVWAAGVEKTYLNSMRDLPLEDDSTRSGSEPLNLKKLT